MHFKLERTLFQQSFKYCIYVFHSAPFVAKKEKRFCNIIDYSVLPIGNSRPGRSSSELVRQK